MYAVARCILLTLVSILAGSSLPVLAQSAASADEHQSRVCLYMMRNLEYTFQTWQSPDAPPRELGEWVRITRKRLNDLQVNAETYDLDEDIVSAYQDVHGLLDDYETFLRDVVYFDLTSNVAKPEQRTFLGEATGATMTAITAAEVGVVVGGPYGGALGLAVGLGVGITNALDNFDSVISKSTEIDQSVKEAKLQLIAQLRRKFEATSEKLKTRAKLLSGRDKYNWQQQVGFDDSGKLPVDEQLKQRPRDSFLYLQSALQKADNDPTSAFRSVVQAAELVPGDFGEDADIFDREKVELLVIAMQIAEDGIHAGKSPVSLAEEALVSFDASIGAVRQGLSSLRPQARLLYARLCGMSGRPARGLAVLSEMVEDLSEDPWYQYEFACVACQCNDMSLATRYLQTSAVLLPRWQPSALLDPRLKPLTNASPDVIGKSLCHVLIGTWKDEKGLTLDFYLDGRLRQSRAGDVKNGTFKEVSGQELELTTSGSVRVFTYQVADEWLTLSGGGKEYKLRRVAPPLVGLWKYSESDRFEFRQDGTWERTRAGETTTGTYMIIPARAGTPALIRYTRSQKSLHQRTEVVEYRISGDVLSVTPMGSNRSYDYHRF